MSSEFWKLRYGQDCKERFKGIIFMQVPFAMVDAAHTLIHLIIPIT